MRKMFIGLAIALALPGCANFPLAGPAPAANATVLDERAAIGVELGYKAARTAMEIAVDAGLLKGALAAQVAALDQRAYGAVLAARAAYKSGNAATYAQAVDAAHAAISGFVVAVKGS